MTGEFRFSLKQKAGRVIPQIDARTHVILQVNGDENGGTP
jgi:hypothetical protein